jgi:hypothetical protein
MKYAGDNAEALDGLPQSHRAAIFSGPVVSARAKNEWRYLTGRNKQNRKSER